MPSLFLSLATAAALTISLAAAPVATTPSDPSTASAAPSLTAPLAHPVWLCHPADPRSACGDATGRYPDGTTVPLSTTVAADGSTTVTQPSTGAEPPVDCFYVYPTVDLLPNPPLMVGSAPPSARDDEVAVLLAQLGPLTDLCRVFAPLYRQSTLAQLALSGATGGDPYPGPGFADVQQAWDDYWAHDNIDPVTGERRGVIVLGHSQGSVAVEELLQHSVDGDPTATAQLVSAVVLGGQVQVPIGATVGGGSDPASTFQHLPLCQPQSGSVPTGCVIAYSSYGQPSGSRPTSGSLADNLDPGHQIACVNPSALLAGAAPDATTPLDPVLPTRTLVRGSLLAPNGALTHLLIGYTLPSDPTGYRATPGALTGRCAFAGDATSNASWLQIEDPTGMLPDTATSALGLHVVDYNVDLGGLHTLLSAQAAQWVQAAQAADPALRR
ncbi:lysophospholipase [Cnuibacter physcomitrellae]|uniref:Uncharacterized protein n=1 Tax=Cnuibacter physcomitrellae TaxID=1619308 RepID=A0A1X9LNV3_9MICO|nr:DUF3089 domain-containing protein [Cnuibacter physcomitrellae]ARJ06866.1 hypothetical protein B5808_17780 [Cnuibacter physcomitrellae]GGI39016.1 lysophospholipase [Cnuibacter physcomitrellae]